MVPISVTSFAFLAAMKAPGSETMTEKAAAASAKEIAVFSAI
jgi:hypothetical protein